MHEHATHARLRHPWHRNQIPVAHDGTSGCTYRLGHGWGLAAGLAGIRTEPFIFGQAGGKSDISGLLSNSMYWNPPTHAAVVAIEAPDR